MDQTRQYAPTVDGIRPDHVERYKLATRLIPKGKYVLDIACGCGYGSWLMEQAGLKVTGVDISQEAIDYAEGHYKGPTYWCQKAEETKGRWDAIVTFETLEHLAHPSAVLSIQAPVIVASVPNEEHYPWSKERFEGDDYPHLRHYTPKEFEDLLGKAGFKVVGKFCQKDKLGVIQDGTEGAFIIFVGSRG